MKDQNSLLKTQKAGQINGYDAPTGDTAAVDSQSQAQTEELKSQLSQRDSTIGQLTAEVRAALRH